MRYLIIIPAYNEQDNILDTVYDLKKNLSSNYDYIVINDCSTDNTESVLLSNHIDHISLPVNLGLSGAVQTGYRYAYENGYDAAMQFDGDGQHKAKYIVDMAKKIESGANIVIGSRFVDVQKDWSLRMIGSRILVALIKIKTHKIIHDPTSGMRMIDRKNLYDYAYNYNYRPEPDTLVSQMRKGNIVEEVPVEMNSRTKGMSYLSSPFMSISYMIRMIISIVFFS